MLLPGTTEGKETIYSQTRTILPLFLIPSLKPGWCPTFFVAWGWRKGSTTFPSTGTQSRVGHEMLSLTHCPPNCLPSTPTT